MIATASTDRRSGEQAGWLRGALARLARAQLWLEHRPAMALVLVVALMSVSIGVELVKRYDAQRSPQEWSLAQRLLTGNTTSMPAAHERDAPGYGIIIALVAAVDPALESEMVCGRGPACVSPSAKSLLVLQFFVVIAGLLSVGTVAYLISGSRSVAFLTLLLTFIGSSFGEPASYYKDYIWVPSLIYVLALVTVLAHRWRSLVMALACGGIFGLLILLKPLLIVAAPLVAVLNAWALADTTRPNRSLVSSLAFLAGVTAVLGATYALIVAPGYYDTSIAMRSVAYDLAVRAGYQAITLPQALIGTLLPIPLVEGLVRALAPAHWVHPFGPFVTGTFANAGDAVVYPAAMAKGPEIARQFSALLDMMAAQSAGYVMSIPSIFARSFFAKTDLVGLIGVFHIARAWAYGRIDQRHRLIAAALGPGVLCTGLNAIGTASVQFSNSHMAFVFAFAIAYVRGRL